MMLKEALKGVLEETELKKVIKSYDVIGDVIIIRLHPDLKPKRAIIAGALHNIYPRVKTIAVVPLYSLTNELYRTRELEVIWGDENMETIHKENGCIFKVNPELVFFSPRLSYERMRVAMKVLPGETIINMFSGVGCFSIVIAKMQPQTKIYSFDVNLYAYEYMKENVALNKMEGNVIPILGDVREEQRDLKSEAVDADRVLMPLPEEAHSFLPAAIRALNLDYRGDTGFIHYYDVSAGSIKGACDLFTASAQKAKDIVSSAFGGTLSVEIEEKRVVRSVAPRKYHVVLDLRVVKTSAQ